MSRSEVVDEIVILDVFTFESSFDQILALFAGQWPRLVHRFQIVWMKAG